MNCIEFESAVEMAVETHTSLVPEALEHAASCAECRLEWEIQRQLDSVIEVWKPVQPPAHLVDSVLLELAKPTVARIQATGIAVDRQAKTRSGVLAVVSVAACLLIVVIFGSRGIDSPRIEWANMAQTHGAESDSLDVGLTLNAVLSDLRSEYHGMANETTFVARELARAIPPRVPVPKMSISEELQTQTMSNNVSKILSPIGTRVESALGFLWQAVPNEIPSG